MLPDPGLGEVKAGRGLDSPRGGASTRPQGGPRARSSRAHDVAVATKEARPQARTGGSRVRRRSSTRRGCLPTARTGGARWRAARTNGGGGRRVPGSGCGQGERWRRVGAGCRGGGGGARARDRAEVHQPWRITAADWSGERKWRRVALGFGRGRRTGRVQMGEGEEEASGRPRVNPAQGHAGQPAGVEVTPPRGRPTGGRWCVGKTEGGLTGRPGARERLTGGTGKGKPPKKQCSKFQIQKLLLPELQNFLNFYWGKIKLPRI
jgi:hypothetical protein